MRSFPRSRAARRLLGTALVAAAVPGCTAILDHMLADTVPASEGTRTLPGLEAPAAIRRGPLGIPFIEAAGARDLAYAMGYAAAADRLAQMHGLRMLAHGRLAESAGRVALGVDAYMRTFDLRALAQRYLEASSERTRDMLVEYSHGVNAYMGSHLERLPMTMSYAGERPEPWEPVDSMSVFLVMNLNLALNLQEELAFLQVARRTGVERAVWLMPTYPGEPVAFDEAEKLADLDLKAAAGAISAAAEAQRQALHFVPQGLGASNNWALAPERTERGASIVANDTHLTLTMPSAWHLAHIRGGDIDAAGVALPGLPGIIAGYNGHVGWGMTMVMADNQDIFLERLRRIDGKLHYLDRGEWVPTRERRETIHIAGGEPAVRVYHETRHGPLLETALRTPDPLEAVPGHPETGYGLAVRWAATEPDATLDAFFALMRSESAAEARAAAERIRAIALNLVFADRDTIGWQVTGRYPLRSRGRGLLPSPGWNGEYDWTGYLDPNEHPTAMDPPNGWLATANDRRVAPDFPHRLSSSWYYPERGERLNALLSRAHGHTVTDSKRMQYDRHSPFAAKLKAVLFDGALADDIRAEIRQWSASRQQWARQALSVLRDFDGDMQPDSAGAAVIGTFMHSVARNAFGDELGAPESDAWAAFVRLADTSYSATPDHLLERGDESPFWDDVTTGTRENKAQILARSLADAARLLRERLGKSEADWAWGRLHTYHWRTRASRLARHLVWYRRLAIAMMDDFLNRGPYPAGGDHTTLNAAGYHMGRGFDTWMIPAMRIVVDFGHDPPLQAVNSTGQSGNPASPHYADGIAAWLEGDYQSFPFERDAIERRYDRILRLRPGDGPAKGREQARK